jgi:hypothetical protein
VKGSFGMEPDRDILTIEQAKKLNEKLFPEVSQKFDDWLAEERKLVDKVRIFYNGSRFQLDKLLHATEIAMTIGVAMFSTRYGIGDRISSTGFHGYDCLYYHNTQHALDIMGRLDKICNNYGVDVFPPHRRLLLALFALFHDLRQQEPGQASSGVGANERASVSEALSILNFSLKEAGFDPVVNKRVFHYYTENMRLMIYGTTFNFVSSSTEMPNLFTDVPAEYTVPVGALAPMVVDQLKSVKPHWESSTELLETIENIYLGSDVDTANVSDCFYEFAIQGVNLCRELEKRKGNFECDSAAVYGFMTGGQEYYFHVAQKYNSDYTKQIFTDEKVQNGKKLARLTKEIRAAYGNPDDECKTVKLNGNKSPAVSGETILDHYLTSAKGLNDVTI